MNKNIIILAPYKIIPAKNAGAKGILYFAAALAKHLNVFLLGAKDNELNAKKNNNLKEQYNFHAVPFFSTVSWKRYLNVFYFFTILKFAKKNKIDTIVFEHPFLPFILLSFRLFTNIKCVYHSHNIEYQRFKSYNKKIWIALYLTEWIYYKTAHIVFTVSEFDRILAIQKFKINANKIEYIPLGITFNQVPTNKIECKNFLLTKYNIPKDTLLLLFAADLGYIPNINALDKIINNIIPLLNTDNTAYKIIICGQKLPLRFNKFKNNPEIIFASFVEDISIYNIGCDIMINPVIEGGGVKVKLLEALAYNTYGVSTESGAIGISKYVCGNKLYTAPNHDWQAFVNHINKISKLKHSENIPTAFFDLYFMDNIAEKTINILYPNN